VLDQQHGDALRAQRLEEPRQRRLLAGAQAGGGLVEDQQRRVRGERAGDLEQALVAERQIAGELEGAVGEADPLELPHRLGARPRLLAAVEAEGAGEEARGRPRVGPEQNGLEQRHVRPQLHMLEGARDAGARDPALALPGDVGAEELDAALIGRERAADQVEHRRLAGAVRPDEAEDLAGAELEADLVDGDEAAEAAGDAGDGEQLVPAVRLRTRVEGRRRGGRRLLHRREIFQARTARSRRGRAAAAG